MERLARQVALEVKAMTRREIITKAINGQISSVAAANIIGITARQMRRIRRAIERSGMSAVMDQRGGRPRRKRIALETIRELRLLKHDVYPDFSIRHFYERVTQQHRSRCPTPGRCCRKRTLWKRSPPGAATDASASGDR